MFYLALVKCINVALFYNLKKKTEAIDVAVTVEWG